MNETGSTVEISCKRYFNHNKHSESIVVQLVHESEMMIHKSIKVN